MAELKTPQELGTEKIGKLLIRYAVPAMIAMLASSLYNIVDRAFIGHGVGPMALSGLAVTFPLMNLSAALGSMVGVGSGTMISLKLGQKDHESAQMLLGNSVTLNILINAFTHLYLGINCILRAAGHPNKAMGATIGTVLLNTLLDYLFIMVFHWGIKGAAIATVISQVLAFVWQCFQLSDKSELIHLKKGTFRLRGDLVRNMITIGLSPCLMNAAACFVVLLINRGLLKYGSDVAIGAYSIINSIGFMVVMMVMGFNQAMQPIAGYNYGARQMGRVLRVLNLTMFFGTCVTTLGFAIGEFLPDLCIRIFTDDPELTAITHNGMKINFIFFPLIGSQMVIGNFFQSIGMPGKSILMSLSRQLLLLIPFLIILPRYYGIDGIWYSMPASDILSVILGFSLLVPQVRKLKKMV